MKKLIQLGFSMRFREVGRFKILSAVTFVCLAHSSQVSANQAANATVTRAKAQPNVQSNTQSNTQVNAQTNASQNKPKGKKYYFREYGMAGCGLGSVVMGKEGGQVFAATTNWTAFNQMFAITLGTSNCDDSPMSEVASRLDLFVNVNKVALAGDVARGNGEALNSVSAILKCSDREHFNSVMQRSFAQIFPSERVAPNDVTDSIITSVMKDEALSKTCELPS
jgi:hypothetical protein